MDTRTLADKHICLTAFPQWHDTRQLAAETVWHGCRKLLHWCDSSLNAVRNFFILENDPRRHPNEIDGCRKRNVSSRQIVSKQSLTGACTPVLTVCADLCNWHQRSYHVHCQLISQLLQHTGHSLNSSAKLPIYTRETSPVVVQLKNYTQMHAYTARYVPLSNISHTRKEKFTQGLCGVFIQSRLFLQSKIQVQCIPSPSFRIAFDVAAGGQ